MEKRAGSKGLCTVEGASSGDERNKEEEEGGVDWRTDCKSSLSTGPRG